MPDRPDDLVTIEPLVGYPREAEVGRSYLLTVDLRIPSNASPWPYDAEEYPIHCMVDAGSLFTSRPVGEPAVILHRFGGTYGPARFLLVAGHEEGEGAIRVTLANQWGTPLRVLELPDVRVSRKSRRDSKVTTRATIARGRTETAGSGWMPTTPEPAQDSWRQAEELQPVATVKVTCPSCGAELPPEVRFCFACGAPLRSAAPFEAGVKVVTVVFCDLVDSSALADELGLRTMRRVMERFAETARRVFARYGGQAATALRGDQIMAVFGLPVAHDDDALRAVRAAAELLEAVSVLEEELEGEHSAPLRVRMGVNTGRVLVNDAKSVEEQVSGHAVIVARRLTEAAEPGGVLIGEETYLLVRDAIRARQVGSLMLRGIAEPLRGYQLLEVLSGRPGRVSRLRAPMLGRDHEMTLLQHTFERVVAGRSCHLVTILGHAGMGKTRLADEFAHSLGERARVLRGHCLAYGDAATLWPLVQIVQQAVGIELGDDPDAAQAELASLLGGEARDRQALSQLVRLLGIGESSFDLAGDTMWAIRRLLEGMARRKPLVLLIEDLHWAQPVLLDALEYLAETIRDEPLMLVCMARPDELFDHRPNWPGGRLNTTSMLLSSLDDRTCEELLVHLLGGRELDPEALAHITYLARGNPLIAEELLATLIDRGVLRVLDGRWIATADLSEQLVPPSVEALLSARLDRLDTGDRRILERAAVVGERFHAADVEALSPGMTPSQVAARLEALVRQELIQYDQGYAVLLPAEHGEGYRFRHIMIRTVVYERISVSGRAELHERFADHLEGTAGERISQFDELIAYHLGEAYRYRYRVQPDEHARQLSIRAGERFAAAGQRAALRGDVSLASSWLGRASRLLTDDHPARLRILPDLASALQSAGELGGALRVYEDIIETARAAGDERTALHAELGRLYVTAFGDLESFLKDGREQIQRTIPLLERLEDNEGLGKAWFLLAYLDWAAGYSERAREKVELSRELLRRAGSSRWEANAVRLHCLILLWGPTPTAEVERHTQEALKLARGSWMRHLEASALTILGRVAAMQGNFDEARRFLGQASGITTELGELLTQAADSISEGTVELLAGDLRAAEAALRRGRQALERMGGTAPLASLDGLMARVLLRQERYEEAEEHAGWCREAAASHQVDAQVKWRSIRAVVRARRGDLKEAERLAREAVERADQTDQVEIQAEARADLGEVLRLAGRPEEATAQLNRAVQLYDRKGDVVAAKQVRSQLISLRR